MSHSCDEAYAVYRETVRKARKHHKCSACRKAIRPGDHYCAVTWVYDGSAGGVKRCGACQLTHLHLRELCGGKHRGNDVSHYDESLWPDERLACGLVYEDEWEMEPPDEIAALPLISDDERGALLRPVTP